MPRFPKAESQVAELAELVVNGLSNAPEDDPAPPVAWPRPPPQRHCGLYFR